MEFTATPKTLSLANFRQSLFGSWIHFLKNDPSIKDLKFQPNNKPLTVTPKYLPDRELELEMPSIVIHRMEERFEKARIGNVFQKFNQTIEGIDYETTVYSIRLCGTYQFDLITRDLPTQFLLTGYLDNKFMGSDKTDELGNIRTGVKVNSVKAFMVKDFSKRTSLQQDIDTLPDTDIYVMWRPHTVEAKETGGFEKELEQYSYTISFWCDLWYSENDDIITSIKVSESRF